jgi:predicted GNAT superfamily acetyltransferase
MTETLGPLTAVPVDTLVALNNAHVVELAYADAARMTKLIASSAALFAQASGDEFPCIVCEVNEAPPNPASDAFHARLGFVEVGRAMLTNGGRLVRYLHHTLQST